MGSVGVYRRSKIMMICAAVLVFLSGGLAVQYIRDALGFSSGIIRVAPKAISMADDSRLVAY
jgi:hypothetical protein